MRIISIANGFQVDYMINYLNSLPEEFDEKLFIGSDIYDKNKISNEVHFINLRGGHEHEANIFQKIFRILLYYVKLVYFLIRKNNKAVIHLQWLRFTVIDGILFPLLFKCLGYKMLYTVHDILPHDRDTKLNRFIFKKIYNIQWKLIAHTEYIKLRLINEFKIPNNKIKVIKHGVYHIGEDKLLDKKLAKKALSVPEKDVVLLFFGYITYYKGLDFLLRVFNNLDIKNLKLIVAGEVKDSYVIEMNNLKTNYPYNVIYKLRYIADEEVQLLFNAADLTVWPYKEASQSGVLFMSYAYGTPVLVPKLGGFPYDVEENLTGLLYEPEDETNFKVKLEIIIEQIKNKNQYKTEQIRQFAMRNYSWQKSGKEMLAFLLK